MDAVAISLIVIPLALILFTVRVEKSAVAMSLIFFELAFIPTFCLTEITNAIVL